MKLQLKQSSEDAVVTLKQVCIYIYIYHLISDSYVSSAILEVVLEALACHGIAIATATV